MTFVILTYREKLLAECSGKFSDYEIIETDQNGTFSAGASSNRTSNISGKAHENGPLRAANAITKNLIKSYYREMLPESPNFEFRDLVVKTTDNFTYTFISYHAIMSEFKTPATQDPKVRTFFSVLLKTRLEIAQLTARLTGDFKLKICNGGFPLQHIVGGEVYIWTKNEPYEIFYQKFLKSKIKSLNPDLGPYAIASNVIQEMGNSPFQTTTEIDLIKSFAIMPTKSLPTFRDWNF